MQHDQQLAILMKQQAAAAKVAAESAATAAADPAAKAVQRCDELGRKIEEVRPLSPFYLFTEFLSLSF